MIIKLIIFDIGCKFIIHTPTTCSFDIGTSTVLLKSPFVIISFSTYEFFGVIFVNNIESPRTITVINGEEFSEPEGHSHSHIH